MKKVGFLSARWVVVNVNVEDPVEKRRCRVIALSDRCTKMKLISTDRPAGYRKCDKS